MEHKEIRPKKMGDRVLNGQIDAQVNKLSVLEKESKLYKKDEPGLGPVLKELEMRKSYLDELKKEKEKRGKK